MVFEWAETVTFLHNIDDGYYTLVADCVVLSREEQGDWVEHALDCEALEWWATGLPLSCATRG